MTIQPQALPDHLTVLAAALVNVGEVTISDAQLAAAEDLGVMFWESAPGEITLRATRRPTTDTAPQEDAMSSTHSPTNGENDVTPR